MPKVTFIFKFKDNTPISELNRFIKNHHPIISYDDPKFYHIIRRDEIYVDEITCPVCGNANAEYGCFDGDVTGYCNECKNYFDEINKCPVYVENPTEAEQCERCELNDPDKCRMKIKED